jgi:hypothetical protein
MLMVTVPIGILFFSLLGAIRSLRDTATLENRASFLILLGFLLLPFVFMSSLATPHDAMRMYMPTFPFLALLAGIGGSTLLDSLGDMGKKASWAALLVLCLVIAAPGAAAISQGTHVTANYYNTVTGGISGAYDKDLEMDYYGESYREAVLWLNDNAPEGARIHTHLAWNILETYKYGDIGQISYRLGQGKHALGEVSGSLGSFSFDQAGLLREDIELVETEEESDYYIMLNRRSSVDISERFGEYLKSCQPVHSIYAGGVPQTLIYKTGCA